MSEVRQVPQPRGSYPGTAREVFGAFLRLGFTGFGGPIAHLGYFRNDFVTRRRWANDHEYADLVALCQFLPGPASSQVGMALGLRRAGMTGLLAAWVAFTMPSAIILVAFAYGMSLLDDAVASGWVYGLKAAAVAVVAQAVIGMAKSLTPDIQRALMALMAAALLILVPHPMMPFAAIAAGGVVGLVWFRRRGGHVATGLADEHALPLSRVAGMVALSLFAVLLVALPLLASLTSNAELRLADTFYRTGSLVFGGGHVVLPLLEAEMVQTGLVQEDVFLAGYGAAQAVPGPLFTFAGFLGASTTGGIGLVGAAIALLAIFLPGALLVIGVLPFWSRIRASRPARAALMGVNAVVVGILAAALYDPVITHGITSPVTLILATGSFLALMVWKVPAWAVVIASGALGYVCA